MENINIKILEIEDYLPLVDYNNLQEMQVDSPNGEELEKMLRDDYGNNIRVERKNQLVLRDLQIVRRLKRQYGCKCQICGYRFKMDNGEYYCEAHHLVPLAKEGTQSAENVILLCANHHRMFHYAKNNISIGDIANGIRKIKIGNEEYEIRYN